jgi:hypothetical protein
LDFSRWRVLTLMVCGLSQPDRGDIGQNAELGRTFARARPNSTSAVRQSTPLMATASLPMPPGADSRRGCPRRQRSTLLPPKLRCSVAVRAAVACISVPDWSFCCICVHLRLCSWTALAAPRGARHTTVMRLTEFDEFPFHQHPTPFNIPSTSDVHFNDGYFCAAFAEDWYVVTGIRLHPNMNVLDGFAGIARGECSACCAHRERYGRMPANCPLVRCASISANQCEKSSSRWPTTRRIFPLR